MVDPDMCAAFRRKGVCRLLGRVWTPWSKHKQSQLKISPVEIGSDLLLLRQVAGWLDLHLHRFISSCARVKACRGWLIYQRKYVLCSYASFTFASNMQKPIRCSREARSFAGWPIFLQSSVQLLLCLFVAVRGQSCSHWKLMRCYLPSRWFIYLLYGTNGGRSDTGLTLSPVLLLPYM